MERLSKSIGGKVRARERPDQVTDWKEATAFARSRGFSGEKRRQNRLRPEVLSKKGTANASLFRGKE